MNFGNSPFDAGAQGETREMIFIRGWCTDANIHPVFCTVRQQTRSRPMALYVGTNNNGFMQQAREWQYQPPRRDKAGEGRYLRLPSYDDRSFPNPGAGFASRHYSAGSDRWPRVRLDSSSEPRRIAIHGDLRGARPARPRGTSKRPLPRTDPACSIWVFRRIRPQGGCFKHGSHTNPPKRLERVIRHSSPPPPSPSAPGPWLVRGSGSDSPASLCRGSVGRASRCRGSCPCPDRTGRAV